MESISIQLCGKNGKGKCTIVDGDYDGEYFSQYRWYFNPKTGYVQRSSYLGDKSYKRDKKVYLHHEVEHPVKGMRVDHINRNKLDNRSSNLRLVSIRQSTINREQPRKNNYKGVAQLKYIGVDGTKHFYNRWTTYFRGKYIGSYSSEIEAAKMWDDVAFKMYGEYGVYNLK